jgi:hypothetical protein
MHSSNFIWNFDHSVSINHLTSLISGSLFLRYPPLICTHLSHLMQLLCKNDINPHCYSRETITILGQIWIAPYIMSATSVKWTGYTLWCSYVTMICKWMFSKLKIYVQIVLTNYSKNVSWRRMKLKRSKLNIFHYFCRWHLLHCKINLSIKMKSLHI